MYDRESMMKNLYKSQESDKNYNRERKLSRGGDTLKWLQNRIENAKTLHISKPLQVLESEMLVRPRKYDEKPLQESRIRQKL